MRVNVTNWAGACQISFNTVLKIVGHKPLLFNVAYYAVCCKLPIANLT